MKLSQPALHRRLRVFLARHPLLYARLLRVLRRGSPEKHACLALIPSGGTVLDIGANEGYFTLLFSDLVGSRGIVHAFEPVPPTFERLAARVKTQACFDNVKLYANAVSSSAGEVTIQMPGVDSGQASLVAHESGSWKTGANVSSWRVKAVRLDDHPATRVPVDFVKCDIEGAELPALTGMSAALKRFQPLLLAEVFADWTRGFGYEPVELFRFLSATGYDRFLIVAETLQRLNDPAHAFTGPLVEQSVNVLCAAPRHDSLLARLR
jgi:FkbM family methyltransferase